VRVFFMKKVVVLLGAGFLALLFTGCVEPVGYGGSYGAVYGEYPSTYSGAYSVEPGYSYVYPSYPYGREYRYRTYGYGRPRVPYDRDHYYDRNHYWDRHAYGHGRDRDDRDDHRRH
jgi:hypothetical protein